MPDLNDLPKYSPWPSRLLGLTQFKQVKRTANELIREFDVEKWGTLLNKFNQCSDDIKLSDLERWHYDDKNEILGWIDNQWKISSSEKFRDYYLNWISDILIHWQNSPYIVELGAGYGSVILNLAKRGLFNNSQFFAAEYSQNGIKLMRKLAERENINITTGYCNFSDPVELDVMVPSESLIYTSFATMYIPELDFGFVRKLLSLKPSIVVHFEPIFEHCNGDDLLSLLRKRYIEINDYNRNLLTLLNDFVHKGEIEIIMEKPPSFGSNPLLAASVLAWRPKMCGK